MTVPTRHSLRVMPARNSKSSNSFFPAHPTYGRPALDAASSGNSPNTTIRASRGPSTLTLRGSSNAIGIVSSLSGPIKFVVPPLTPVTSSPASLLLSQPQPVYQLAVWDQTFFRAGSRDLLHETQLLPRAA